MKTIAAYRTVVIAILGLSLVACSTSSSWSSDGYETLLASADTKRVPAGEKPAGEKPASGGASDEELNKQSQNPIANLISLPLQNNTNFNVGTGDKTTNVLNVQPVVPFSLGDWNMIVRDVMPVIYLPDDLYPGFDSQFGLGDSLVTFFFSPVETVPFLGGYLTWGVGPVVYVPTSTDDSLGAGQWGMGASAVALAIVDKWVFGAIANNVTSFGGDVNQFLVQPFINYNLPGAWAISTGPSITANWKADGDQQWTVPVGIGVSKLLRFGKQPVKFALTGYAYAAKPDDSADWTLQFQVTFLFPK